MPRTDVPGSDLPRLYVFGKFRLVHGDEPIHLPTRKVESLLAYLVLFPTKHSREKLASLIWGEVADSQARASLRNALSILRNHLGTKLLVADRRGVGLNPQFHIWGDANEFRRLAGKELSVSDWAAASELYQGDLLADFYDDWALDEREYYRALYVDTLMQLVKQLQLKNEHERAIHYARRALDIDPANESAYQQLISSHLVLGDRHSALRAYEECKKILKSELAADPMPETVALYEKAKRPAPERAPLRPASYLPAPISSFIGREKEMRELQELVPTTRLVTLTGAGGSGKTRLTIQVARELLDLFDDGVWWVELSNWTDPGRVPQAVAEALNLHATGDRPLLQSLADFLQPKKALLILDDCEHLVRACAQLVKTLLENCPLLKIIVTSREGLNIVGERIYHVPTLSLPEEGPLLLSNLAQYDSIRLFQERVRDTHPGFVLIEQNFPAVVQICKRLDGSPLAIELAAARVQILSIEQIAARLDDQFSLLRTSQQGELPRHQTLRATMDWSYDLLDFAEQQLFQRLAIFAGGWTLEAAEAVCGDSILAADRIIDLLMQLANKSMIIAEFKGNEMRYRMLDTLRHYAAGKIKESAEPWQDRHLAFFLALAEKAKPKLWSGEQSRWLERLDTEQDNLRAALGWAFSSQKVDMALRLVSALWRYWEVRGYTSEGGTWLDRALEISKTGMPSLRASVLRGAGHLACQQGDYERATAFHEQALDLMRDLGETRGVARVLDQLGELARYQCNYPLAQQLHEESLALRSQFPEELERADSLANLGMVALERGDYKRAVLLFEESLEMRRTNGDRLNIAFSLNNLGLATLYTGNPAKAAELCRESLEIYRELGDKSGIASALDDLGEIACQETAPGHAEPLLNESLALRRELGDRRGIARTLGVLGDLSFSLADYDRAVALYKESLLLYGQLLAKRGIAHALVKLASARWHRECGIGSPAAADLVDIAQMLGAAQTVLESIQVDLVPRDQAEFHQILAAVQVNLEDQVLQRAWAQGASLAFASNALFYD